MPGQGARWTSAWRAISVLRGSITIRRAPRRRASSMGPMKVKWETGGLAPHRTIRREWRKSGQGFQYPWTIL